MDAVVAGFGYEPFSILGASWRQGRLPGKGRGILTAVDADAGADLHALKLNGRPTCNPASLNPIPDWAAYLNPDVAIAERTTNLITSEGCARHCTYCSEPRTSAGRWLTFDVEQMVEIAAEISVRSGANGFKLHDPNFFHDSERATRFATRFSRALGLPWAATLHPADLLILSERQLQGWAQAGLSRVLVGLESPDPQIIRWRQSNMTPPVFLELATKLARAAIRGMFTFIVGWPGAPADHYERTIECAKAIRDCWHEHQGENSLP